METTNNVASQAPTIPFRVISDIFMLCRRGAAVIYINPTNPQLYIRGRIERIWETMQISNNGPDLAPNLRSSDSHLAIRVVTFEGEAAEAHSYRKVRMIRKPLEQMADEDVLAIMDLHHGSILMDLTEDEYRAAYERLFTAIKVGSMVTLSVIYYLWDAGYALPYHPYSVEDLVKAGVYELHH